LNLPRLSLTFDADCPEAGLTAIAVADQPWSGGRLLGIRGSIQAAEGIALCDWHVRGDDLIAAYEIGPPDAARFDVLWHAAQPAAGDAWLGRLDLLVSVRTDRLDWRYDVRLQSVLPDLAARPLQSTTANFFAGRVWSIAMMVHPADLGRQELTSGAGSTAGCNLQQQLFRTESLEKGVILRARARAWFLPANVDPAVVIACFDDFAAADPPLGI
jgi:hypothetical protein